MRHTIVLALLLASSSAWGAQQVVWQIGKPDHDYSEFACAGNYSAYAKQFGAKPVVFEVGRSEPGRDWPYIQPGPHDTWSPAKGRPWTIRFTLPGEPRGIYLLRIELADVHKLFSPLYSVTVGRRTGTFRLAPGGGDASLTNPKAGKPQKIELLLPAADFKKGVNQIRLACIEGSWVQYDAITLSNDPDGKFPPAEIRSLTGVATPFFMRRDGQLRRAMDVSVTLNAPASEVALHAETAGQAIDVPLHPSLGSFGAMGEEIAIPDSSEPIDVKLTATVEGRSKTTTVHVLPERKWRIYVAPSSHTDIGYTAPQPECAERHCQNIDTAIDLLHRFPDFAWNLEAAWQAENYVNSRTGQRLADFYRFAREGKIGIQALYCNELTGLCSAEEACRLTSFAHRLCREQNIPYRSAMISDVPVQEASIPMILASAGIRYFSSGINNDRAYNFTELQDKCPLWWEGPDGSRVLMMYTWQYAQASQWALTQSLPAAQSRVLEKLAQYDGRNYPYDAVFLHGAVSDNQPLDVRLADVAKEWNERYEYPKIILSHNAEFFEYIEKHYGDKLPVLRGSPGTYWEDGAGSSARETKLCRNAHESLANGEKFLALADRIAPAVGYNAAEIYKAWRNCILFDEHTWGAHCSISQPDSDFTKTQWKIKAQFAVDADRQSGAIFDQGSKSLAGLVKTDGPALVVFNPTSWPRTDILRVELPEGLDAADPAMHSHASPHGTFMLVKDVPACGYRVIPLAPKGKQPVGEKVDGQAIESRFYRVEFDPATGGIASIRDKELGRELVDRKAPWKLNQYVYVAGGNGSRIVMNPHGPAPELKCTGSGPATFLRKRRPGLGEIMSVHTSGTMAPEIISAVLVWDDIKRIDIVDRLSKKQTYDKEAVYFAFPFAAERPTFRYEVPAAVVNANKDMLPGASLEWFTVQHFVEVEGAGATIAWATPDAPLACFQDINRGTWPKQLSMTTGHLYSYAMNNYWHTNYLAGQGGDIVFRYAITSRPKSDNVASARFGWAASNPLRGVAVKANPGGTLPAEPTSLVSVDEPGVIVIGAKRADEGPGLIVRLWELTGHATTAHLHLDRHIPAAKAQVCNLVEEIQGPLEIHDGQVAVPIRGSGLATVRID